MAPERVVAVSDADNGVTSVENVPICNHSGGNQWGRDGTPPEKEWDPSTEKEKARGVEKAKARGKEKVRG